MSNKDQTDVSFYISIATGLLLTVSEILPFINNIKSNGIIQLITDVLLKRSKTITATPSNVENDQPEEESETSHLIPKPTNQPHSSHILSEVSNVTITSQNVQFTFNSPNVKLDFNENCV